MKNTLLLTAVIIFISFIIGIYFYPQMPDLIASHWGVNGEVNGYMPKILGLFLMPVISTFMFILFILLPKIDPLKENVVKFKSYYDGFILLLTGFLFYLHLVTIFWNLGYRFNMIQVLSPALAALFYYIGILLSHSKRNWFIGIRTPWTLSNDKVWDKTHLMGSKLFKLAAIICILGIIFPESALWFVLALIITVSLYLFLYSYLVFKQ